jgi:hypothetical protein
VKRWSVRAGAVTGTYLKNIEITNIKQFPITEIRKSKQWLMLEGSGHCILEFVILDRKLQGRAIYL